jgi:hypothetical protein
VTVGGLLSPAGSLTTCVYLFAVMFWAIGRGYLDWIGSSPPPPPRPAPVPGGAVKGRGRGGHVPPAGNPPGTRGAAPESAPRTGRQAAPWALSGTGSYAP